MDKKLCVTCRYSFLNTSTATLVCTSPEADWPARKWVTGGDKESIECETARWDINRCGPDGNWWASKEETETKEG
jgi:hypothetical protein